MISDAEGIHHVLHDQGAVGEAGRPAEVDDLAEGDHQLVVGNGRDLVAAADGHVNRLRRKVDLANLGDPNPDAGQKQPQRAHRIGRLYAAAGHLGEQRLEHEEIIAADQLDVDVTTGTPL